MIGILPAGHRAGAGRRAVRLAPHRTHTICTWSARGHALLDGLGRPPALRGGAVRAGVAGGARARAGGPLASGPEEPRPAAAAGGERVTRTVSASGGHRRLPAAAERRETRAAREDVRWRPGRPRGPGLRPGGRAAPGLPTPGPPAGSALLSPGHTTGAAVDVPQHSWRHHLPAGSAPDVGPRHGGVSCRTVVHQAAISARRAAPSLARMCVMCAEMVLGASTSCSAICRLVRPAATS
jgi:hypothetical protein